jgi:PAS domain S-box-containing protein
MKNAVIFCSAKSGSVLSIKKIISSVGLKILYSEAFFAMSVKKRSRQAELAFQAQLLASINDAVCAVDENNIITYWNSMAEKLFGWSAEEVMEKPSLIITEPGDEMIRIPQSGQYTGEIPNYHKNGEMINTDVHAAVLRGRNGELRGKVAILRDITEKKRYESSLQRREQEYLEIIDSFFEGAFISDLVKGEIYYSKEWQKRLGIDNLSPKEAFCSLTDLVHPDDIARIKNTYFH